MPLRTVRISTSYGMYLACTISIVLQHRHSRQDNDSTWKSERLRVRNLSTCSAGSAVNNSPGQWSHCWVVRCRHSLDLIISTTGQDGDFLFVRRQPDRKGAPRRPLPDRRRLWAETNGEPQGHRDACGWVRERSRHELQQHISAYFSFSSRPKSFLPNFCSSLFLSYSGSVDKQCIEVTNCFCIPHKEYDERVEADLQYAQDMFELNRKVAPQEALVGWFATGQVRSSRWR